MSIYLLTYCWLNSLGVGDRLREEHGCKVKPALFPCRPTAEYHQYTKQPAGVAGL